MAIFTVTSFIFYILHCIVHCAICISIMNVCIDAKHALLILLSWLSIIIKLTRREYFYIKTSNSFHANTWPCRLSTEQRPVSLIKSAEIILHLLGFQLGISTQYKWISPRFPFPFERHRCKGRTFVHRKTLLLFSANCYRIFAESGENCWHIQETECNQSQNTSLSISVSSWLFVSFRGVGILRNLSNFQLSFMVWNFTPFMVLSPSLYVLRWFSW